MQRIINQRKDLLLSEQCCIHVSLAHGNLCVSMSQEMGCDVDKSSVASWNQASGYFHLFVFSEGNRNLTLSYSCSWFCFFGKKLQTTGEKSASRLLLCANKLKFSYFDKTKEQ